jgi:hypothetical protein
MSASVLEQVVSSVPSWLKVLGVIVGMSAPIGGVAYLALNGIFMTVVRADDKHEEIEKKIEAHKEIPAHPVSASQQKSTQDQVEQILKNQKVMNENLIRLGERQRMRMERITEKE